MLKHQYNFTIEYVDTENTQIVYVCSGSSMKYIPEELRKEVMSIMEE